MPHLQETHCSLFAFQICSSHYPHVSVGCVFQFTLFNWLLLWSWFVCRPGFPFSGDLNSSRRAQNFTLPAKAAKPAMNRFRILVDFVLMNQIRSLLQSMNGGSTLHLLVACHRAGRCILSSALLHMITEPQTSSESVEKFELLYTAHSAQF